MGWRLEKRETKKHGVQYKIWTTISDGWITKDWMSREEILKFLFWHKMRDAFESFMDEVYTFPDSWYDNNGNIVEDRPSARDEWYEFQRKSIGNPEFFYNTLFKELDKLGINVDINDGKFQVKTLEK